MYNIVSIVSYSGVGKTTLVQSIVSELCMRGYKVGTIKHTCHDFEIDKEGKDSYKHRISGASKVCLVSKNRVAYMEDSEEEKSLYDIIKLYNDMDLIIIEGYKKYRFKKLEITRKDKYESLISNHEDLIGIVSDIFYDLDIKQFGINDYKCIADYIELCIKNKQLELHDEKIKQIESDAKNF